MGLGAAGTCGGVWSAKVVGCSSRTPFCPAPRPQTVVEEVGPPPPNGTAFCITTAAAPTLDGTSLVVGRVVEGMDLVQRIAALPTVPDNTGSPLFAAAKSIGDKRASVAELGFNRPYAKVVVKGSGVTASVAMAAGACLSGRGTGGGYPAARGGAGSTIHHLLVQWGP